MMKLFDQQLFLMSFSYRCYSHGIIFDTNIVQLSVFFYTFSVSGCTCSSRDISPPPITVVDDPAVTVLPTRASEPSGTTEPHSNSTDRESYDGSMLSKGVVESYSSATLSTVVFSIVPNRVSEATEPEFAAMAAMMVGISLLVVFLVSLVLAAVIVGVVFSVWWRKHHPREKGVISHSNCT